MRRRSAGRRGQAAVELALGAVVFVGVLMAGIHLAEYAQLSLKVQDAQTFAVWQASTRRVQARRSDGSTDTAPFERTLDATTGVAAAAQRRFADFNGLTGTDDGNTIGRALTEGSAVAVRCRAEGSLGFQGSPAVDGPQLMRDVGGLSCRASAQIRAINVPEAFLHREQGGFFAHGIVRRQPIAVCGMGLPVEGQCRGALAVLTNDWGLVKDETNQCKLYDCTDTKYREMIRVMFGGGGGGAGAAFASEYAGSAPVSAGSFFFSYAGVESNMRQTLAASEGEDTFITGGAGTGMVPQLRRPNCFLGKACP